MPDNDLTIRFGGDASGLNAAVAQARATVAGFAPGATAAAKSSLDAFAASMRDNRVAADQATAGWRDNLQAAANASLVYGGLRTALGDLVSANNAAARATLSLDAAIAGGIVATFKAEAVAIAEADRSLIGYFTSAAYAQRGPAMFAVANEGMVASIGRAILAVESIAKPFQDAYLAMRLYFSGVSETALAAVGAAGNIRQLSGALNEAGIKESAQLLSPLIFQLEQIPGVSNDAAVSIVTMLTAIPNYTPASLDVMVKLLQTLAQTSDEAKAMAKSLADAFKDPVNGGATLGGIAAQIKNMDALRTVTQQWAKALTPDQAVSMLDTITKKLGDQRAMLDRQIADEQAKIAREGEEGDVLGNVYHTLTSQSAEYEKHAATLTRTIGLLNAERDTQTAISDELKKQNQYQELIGKGTTRVGRANTANDNLALLNNSKASQGRSNDDAEVGSDRDLLIRTLIGEADGEGAAGMEAVANVIRNRVESAFDGMKTYRDVITEGGGKQFNSYYDSDPSGQRARALSTDSPEYLNAAAIVDKLASGNLEDNTNGATSFYAKGAPNAFPMSNTTKIGKQIFGNTPGSPPVRGSDDDDERNESITKQLDTLKQIDDEKRGGTNIDLADNEALKQQADGLHDVVAQAQAKLMAARQDQANVAATGDMAALRTATNAVSQAEEDLAQKIEAARKAQAAFNIARLQSGSKAELDATLANLNAEIAAATGNAAKIAELQKQKLDATKSFNAQEADNEKAAANDRYDTLQKSLANQLKLIEENQKNSIITPGNAQGQTAAVYAQERAAAQQHADDLLAIDRKYGTDSVAEIRKITTDKAKEIVRANADMTASVQKAAAEMDASFKSHFESIGSTVSGDLMGMMEHTKRFSDLMADVAKNIVSQFLSAGVKMVADWLAHQAAMTAATLLGQTTQTGAVAAGQAEQSAILGAGFLKTIAADAAAAEAGAIAFLSPVLGPLATGPGAALGALVSGLGSLVPSFDVGAWSLPSDMVAQVHAGEMIVPAGPAALMRAAAGGGSGDASSGRSFNPTINYHSHGRRSKADILSEVDVIVGGLKQAHRNGAFLKGT